MKTRNATLLLLAGLLSSCGGSSPTASSPTAPTSLSTFSGVWTGRVTITQVGACPYIGTTPETVTMTWTASDSGDVTIVETGEGSPKEWKGTVSPELNVSLTKTNPYGCGAGATYTGTIVRQGAAYKLETQANEARCPPADACIFNMAYSISK